MSKVKVIPRLPRWRRLVWLYALGLVLLGINILALPWLSYQSAPARSSQGVTTGASYVHVGIAVTCFLVVPVILVVLSLTEQRVGRAILEAIAMWAGAVTAVAAWAVLGTLSGAAQAAILLAVLFVVVRMLGLAAVRLFFRTVVVQTGSLCESCGYNLTGNVSGICPECGTSVLPSTGSDEQVMKTPEDRSPV